MNYRSTMDLETFQTFGLDQNFGESHGDMAVNGRRNIEIVQALDTEGDVDYHPCAEALADPPDRASEVVHIGDWRSEKVFPGTTRHLWIVSSTDLGPDDRPCLLVFNDGGGYLNPEGAIRAPRVFDVLRADATVPPVVGVFVSPGRPVEVPGTDSPFDMNLDPRAQRQRSVEYDTMSDRYVSLLADEILPFVETHLGFGLDPDPARRGIVGISSGGICSWTAAWHRPDLFGLVVSHCGSFVNIRGGHNWPYVIRSNERRPIKVFLQSGALDANIIYGNWPLANQQMAAALEFADYEHRFEFGTGGHSLQHGGSIFADTLRWLFAGLAT